MQRGLRQFQSLLFDAPPPSAVAQQDRRSGRSAVLVQKRNMLIAARYYYYVRLQRRNYPDTLAALQAEFFLSDFQISRIIGEAGSLLAALKQQQPTARQLAQQYPHLVW